MQSPYQIEELCQLIPAQVDTQQGQSPHSDTDGLSVCICAFVKQSDRYSQTTFMLSYETGAANPHDPRETCFASITATYICSINKLSRVIPPYYQMEVSFTP